MVSQRYLEMQKLPTALRKIRATTQAPQDIPKPLEETYDLSTPEGQIDYITKQREKIALAKQTSQLPTKRQRFISRQQREAVRQTGSDITSQEQAFEQSVVESRPDLAKQEYIERAYQKAASSLQPTIDMLKSNIAEREAILARGTISEDRAASMKARISADRSRLNIYEDAIKGDKITFLKDYTSGQLKATGENIANQIVSEQQFTSQRDTYMQQQAKILGIRPMDLPNEIKYGNVSAQGFIDYAKQLGLSAAALMNLTKSGKIEGYKEQLAREQAGVSQVDYNEYLRLQKVMPTEGYYDESTGKVLTQEEYLKLPRNKMGLSLQGMAYKRIFLDSQGNPIQDIEQYYADNKIPTTKGEEIDVTKTKSTTLEMAKLTDIEASPKDIKTILAALSTPTKQAYVKPDKSIGYNEVGGVSPVTAKDITMLIGGARLGGLVVTGAKGVATKIGVLLHDPISRTTASIVNKLIPQQDTGFAAKGFLPQVGRGLLYTGAVAIPGVGAAFLTQLVKSAAINPKETMVTLKEYVFKNPYEIGSLIAGGSVKSRIGEVQARNKLLNEIDRKLIETYGKDSVELKKFRKARILAFGEGFFGKGKLPMRVNPIKEWSSEQLKAVKGDPLLTKIINEAVSKYKPTIIGSSTLLPYLSLKTLRRGLQGDIDVQDVQGIINSQSEAMAQELYRQLIQKGYNAKYGESNFAGYKKYHVTLNGKELLNAGTSVEYFFKTQLGVLRGLFEPEYLGQTIKAKVKGGGETILGTLRGQLRVKLIKGYGDNIGRLKELDRLNKADKLVGREKDILDVLDIVEGTKSLFKDGKYIGEKVPYTIKQLIYDLREIVKQATYGRIIRYKNIIAEKLGKIIKYSEKQLSKIKLSEVKPKGTITKARFDINNFLTNKVARIKKTTQKIDEKRDMSNLLIRAERISKDKYYPQEKRNINGYFMPQYKQKKSYAKPKSVYAKPSYPIKKIPYKKEPYPQKRIPISNYLTQQPKRPSYPITKKTPYFPKIIPNKVPPYKPTPYTPRKDVNRLIMKNPEKSKKKIEKKISKKKQRMFTMPTAFEQLVRPVKRGQRAKVKIRGFELFRFRR